MKSLLVKITALFLMIFAVIMPFMACTETGTSKPRPTVQVPAATSDFYVNDFAGAFTSSQKAELMDRALELANTKNGIQVVITTVTSLNGKSIEDYAYSMYNTYGIGRNDMGLLILMSTGDRLIRVEVGKQMEAYINDSKAGRFIDNYAIPSLKENKFAEGLISLQKAFVEEINATVPAIKVEEPTEVPAIPTQEIVLSTEMMPLPELPAPTKYESSDTSIMLIVFAILAAIATLVGLTIGLIKKGSNGKRLKKEQEEEIERLKALVEELQRETGNLRQEQRRLSSVDSTLQREREKTKKQTDLLARIRELHPGIDSEVEEMIRQEEHQKDLEAAEGVDIIFQRVLLLQIAIGHIGDFREAVTAYHALTDRQKQCMKTGDQIGEIQKRLDASEEMQFKESAKQAAKEIEDCISGITAGREENLRTLKRAEQIYKNLKKQAKEFFDKSLLSRLNRLLDEAEEDENANRSRRQREEEEERQRQQSYYNNPFNNTFGGSSGGFGGFGGSSGGGGATRGF